MDEFTEAYVEAALWSSTDDESEPLDKNYGPDDIHPDTLKKMEADAEDFQKKNLDDIQSDPARAGHDFWLTRNGHGAGFWDGDWPEEAAERLTRAAHSYGEFFLYVGDDGMIHGSAGNPDDGEENPRAPGDLLNSKEDMKWLRDVHLPGLSGKYKSALIYGNEDWPEKIEVYEKTEPLVTDKPVVFYPDEDGKFGRGEGEKENPDSEEEGWRSYGPGKFDSIVSSYIYAISLDGGADEEVGDVGDFGWYGIMGFQPGEALKLVEEVAKEDKDELTEEEREELKDVVGVILSEDSDGFVSVDYFESERKLEAKWKEIEEAAEEFYEGAEEEG